MLTYNTRWVAGCCSRWSGWVINWVVVQKGLRTSVPLLILQYLKAISDRNGGSDQA